MRIAILCNGRTLAEWQRRAIELISRDHELYLLICDDPPLPRRLMRHGFYYLLNPLSVRNRLTRQAAFPKSNFRIVDRIEFKPDMDGAWASLPHEVLGWIARQRIDAMVKFGLNLLRVPEGNKLGAPILSFHHGDTRAFRGRPAGFHELMRGERFIGQVVQKLSNELDSGEVLAFAESRVADHSYRRTLIDVFRLSPLLLPKALAALEEGRRLPIEPSGPAYRLPSNMTVLRFAGQRLAALVRRLAYGAFVEKRWKVSTAETRAAEPLDAIKMVATSFADWQTLPIRPPYRFLADPFFHGASGASLLEAMNGRTGKGELVRIDGDDQRTITGLAGHVSYPASVNVGGREYVVPGTRSWSRHSVVEIVGNRAERIADLDIDEPALLDPTFLRHEGRFYLFANRRSEGPCVLRLWSAEELFGRFGEHPQSPIRISIRGGRMAGPVHHWPGGLIRLGQDFRTAYGDGVIAFRIDELSSARYRETELGAGSFDRVKGPHTLDFRNGTLLFDWYEERISLLAGIRRLMNRL